MSKERKMVTVFLSIVALLNVMFVPIYDTWGGLFPGDTEWNFFDVINMICADSYYRKYWVVRFTMSIFVPVVLMLITSLIGNRSLFLISSALGIILWFRQIVFYEDQCGFDNIWDYDDSCVAIGTWIAIIIFIVSFFVALSSEKKVEDVIINDRW